MKNTRRIGLFLCGIILGCIMVYFTLIKGQNRTYWFPGNRVKDLILNSEIIYSPHATCMMKCRNISQENVMEVLKNGRVNFRESNAHHTPCPIYAVEGELSENKKIRILVTTVDSIAEIETAIELTNFKKDTCLCN